MSNITLPTKNTAETLEQRFDFLSRLALGETITNAVVTATVFSGVDATPSAVISGVATVDGTEVAQVVTGGTAGVTYCLSCAATTSAGQELLINGYMAVVSNNPF